MPQPTLRPIYIDGVRQVFFRRREFEDYKRQLAGLGPAPPGEPVDLEEFVCARRACRELDISRRGLGRRIAGSRAPP
jgi:hypothetical protein